MSRKRKVYDDDDGRTIADMNVDGMPWYRPENGQRPASPMDELSKKEGRALMWGVLGAAMLVALVFVVGYLIFILLVDKVFLP